VKTRLTDPYLLDNGVLRSLLRDRNDAEIRNGYDLRDREGLFTQIRIAQILKTSIAGNFDLAHMQGIHQHIFQDVYDWAGQLRTVPIAKDIVFTDPDDLQAEFDAITAQATRLRSSDGNQIADELAETHIAINRWHGFREGNGRANRMFIRLLAHDCSVEIAFERMNATELNGAHILANAGMSGQMKSLFRRNMRALKPNPISPHPSRRITRPTSLNRAIPYSHNAAA
jgi:cell filamentation protein